MEKSRDQEIIEERFMNNLKIIQKFINIEKFDQMILDYLLGYSSDIKLNVGENMEKTSYSEISRMTDCLNNNYIERYFSDKLTSEELEKFKNVKFCGDYAYGEVSFKKIVNKHD